VERRKKNEIAATGRKDKEGMSLVFWYDRDRDSVFVQSHKEKEKKGGSRRIVVGGKKKRGGLSLPARHGIRKQYAKFVSEEKGKKGREEGEIKDEKRLSGRKKGRTASARWKYFNPFLLLGGRKKEKEGPQKGTAVRKGGKKGGRNDFLFNRRALEKKKSPPSHREGGRRRGSLWEAN